MHGKERKTDMKKLFLAAIASLALMPGSAMAQDYTPQQISGIFKQDGMFADWQIVFSSMGSGKTIGGRTLSGPNCVAILAKTSFAQTNESFCFSSSKGLLISHEEAKSYMAAQ